MNFIDILIFVICISGLIYFAFNHIKYSNPDAFRQKLERLNELQTLIQKINAGNEEIEKLILPIIFEKEFNDSPADTFILYRDNYDRLSQLKDECGEIETYLRKARPYIKNSLYEHFYMFYD